MIMEGDPFVLIEGMTIAGIAVGATKGYIYIRSEYPHAIRSLGRAIDIARREGYLGGGILGTRNDFDLEIRVGAGAYICGEETSLLESLEGGAARCAPSRRCRRIKGLFGKPTVVNNVITLATVPIILADGADFYRDFGMGRSRGTLPIQLAGNIKHGGLVETAFGMTLRELRLRFRRRHRHRPADARRAGRRPAGRLFSASSVRHAARLRSLRRQQGLLGHGGIVVFDDTVDMAQQARFAMEFCAIESCGKCTPCRIGSTRGVEVIDRIIAGERRAARISAAERSLRDHELRFAVRAGRIHAAPGDERAEPFSRRFRHRPASGAAAAA